MKKGISLITLIITIIVVIILAGAVILNLQNTNVMNNAEKASFFNDVDSLTQQLDLFKSKKMIETNGEYKIETLQADNIMLEYDEEIIEGNITTVLPQITKSKYSNTFQIEDGKLVYTGIDAKILEWITEKEIISVGGKLTSPVIILDKTEDTMAPVTVTIEYSSNSIENTYSLDNVEFIEYTGPFEIYNNYEITARAKNIINEEIESILIVDNILDGADAGAILKEEPENYTPIYSIEGLEDIKNDLEGNYILMKNLDLDIAPYNEGAGWIPIGDSSTKFKGVFDGNGLTISNLYVNKTSNYAGLFGYINTANISNLTLSNVSVTGTTQVGGLVGYAHRTKIESCSASGNISGTSTNVGGLIGSLSDEEILNCNTSGTVSGTSTNSNIGGLVGQLYSGSSPINLTNSYSTSTVSGYNCVGGLIGEAKNYTNSGCKIDITNCYASGNVTGPSNSDYLGGLIGKAISSNRSTNNLMIIDKVYASGNVTGASNSEYVGGLIGIFEKDDRSYTNRSNLMNAYATGEVNGLRYIGGLVGKTEYVDVTNTYSANKVTASSTKGALIASRSYSDITNSYWCSSTSGLQTSSGGTNLTIQSMVNQSSYNSWDFVTIWDIQRNATTPYLRNMPVPDKVYLENIEYAEYTSGTGTEEDPYIVMNEEDLNNIRKDMLSSYKLGADITLTLYQTGEGWTPIGDSTNPFKGTFDGNGHTISNLYIDTTSNNTGLFGYIENSEVVNLTLNNVDITGTNYVGTIAGINYYSTINTCSVSGTITSNSRYVGGLIGYNYCADVLNCNSNGEVISTSTSAEYIGGLIGKLYSNSREVNMQSCYSTSNVTGYNSVGGLIGEIGNFVNSNSKLNMTTCYATGNVIGTNDYIGGLAGKVISSNRSTSDIITIDKVYASGNVIGASGSQYVGGLIGIFEKDDRSYTNRSKLMNAYAIGEVTGTNYVAGLIGKTEYVDVTNTYAIGEITATSTKGGLISSRSYSNITNSYWDTETTTLSTSSGGIGKLTSEMMQSSIYTGWDFTNIWNIQEGTSYPNLR